MAPGAGRRSDVGVRTFFCGPESFTPDLAPVVGEAPELRNYFVAAGLNSIGILTGGGLGRAMAHWIVDGRPGHRRDRHATSTGCTRYQTNPEYRAHPHRRVARAWSTSATTPDARCGRRAAPSARPCTTGWPPTAPTSGTSAAGRAPTGTPRPASSPVVGQLSWGRQNWFPYWAAEHRAAREGVDPHGHVVHVQVPRPGPRRRARCSNGVSANRVDGEPGVDHLHPVAERARHARGRPHRHQARRRPVLGGRVGHRAPARRDLAAPARRRRSTRSSPTSPPGCAQLNVQGPRSRELLQSLTSADLSNEAFPFRTAREIDLGFARVLCVRITYLGELGYELYVPTEQAVHVYDRLVAAGAAVRPAARRAQGAVQPADGEGLPRLRPRHRQHRLGARGRARLRGRAGQAGRLHRPGRRAREEGRGAAHPTAGPGPAARPRAADVPRRGGATATACRSATCGRRPTASPSAVPSGWP